MVIVKVGTILSVVAEKTITIAVISLLKHLKHDETKWQLVRRRERFKRSETEKVLKAGDILTALQDFFLFVCLRPR